MNHTPLTHLDGAVVLKPAVPVGLPPVCGGARADGENNTRRSLNLKLTKHVLLQFHLVVVLAAMAATALASAHAQTWQSIVRRARSCVLGSVGSLPQPSAAGSISRGNQQTNASNQSILRRMGWTVRWCGKPCRCRVRQRSFSLQSNGV